MNKTIRKAIQSAKPFIKTFSSNEDIDDLVSLFLSLGLRVYRDPEYDDVGESYYLVTNHPLTFRRYVQFGKSNDDDWPQEWVADGGFRLDREMNFWAVTVDGVVQPS